MTGQDIRQYRTAMKLTQGELARLLTEALGTGYTASLVSYMEQGIVDAPKKVREYIANKTREKPFRNLSVASNSVKWINTLPNVETPLKSAVLPNKRITQEDRVLQYIKDFGSITSWEAFSQLGITRLSAKIFDLDKMGYRFKKQTEYSTNRYGKKVHYTRYSLIEGENEQAHLD